MTCQDFTKAIRETAFNKKNDEKTAEQKQQDKLRSQEEWKRFYRDNKIIGA